MVKVSDFLHPGTVLLTQHVTTRPCPVSSPLGDAWQHGLTPDFLVFIQLYLVLFATHGIFNLFCSMQNLVP